VPSEQITRRYVRESW